MVGVVRQKIAPDDGPGIVDALAVRIAAIGSGIIEVRI
jgi:hypothetical protein